MKIIRIQWQSHPILGDLLLNFYNSKSSEAYSSIILAGENGTGKSTILDCLMAFLSGEYPGNRSFLHFVQFEIDNQFFVALRRSGSDELIMDPIIHQTTDQIPNIEEFGQHQESTSETGSRFRTYGAVLSRARSEYKNNNIRSTTAQELDQTLHDNDQSEDYTPLAQLLVDINQEDNDDYAELNKNSSNSAMSWNEFEKQSKLARFKLAFNSFFETLKFDKVARRNGRFEIQFVKHSAQIPIEKLSTGEKQIVFRGGQILKNQQRLDNGIVIIDEPEISLHPKWQQKIFSYYRHISGDNSQLFISTHSDHAIEDVILNANETSLIITITNRDGIIEQNNSINNNESVLPEISSSEIEYLAFGIVSIDYFIQLFTKLSESLIPSDVDTISLVNVDSHIQSRIGNHPNAAFLLTETDHPNGRTKYFTLPVKVRNIIHHPGEYKFTEEELRISTEFIREILA